MVRLAPASGSAGVASWVLLRDPAQLVQRRTRLDIRPVVGVAVSAVLGGQVPLPVERRDLPHRAARHHVRVLRRQHLALVQPVVAEVEGVGERDAHRELGQRPLEGLVARRAAAVAQLPDRLLVRDDQPVAELELDEVPQVVAPERPVDALRKRGIGGARRDRDDAPRRGVELLPRPLTSVTLRTLQRAAMPPSCRDPTPPAPRPPYSLMPAGLGGRSATGDRSCRTDWGSTVGGTVEAA